MSDGTSAAGRPGDGGSRGRPGRCSGRPSTTARPRPRARRNGNEDDPAPRQVGLVQGERVDRPCRQRELVERKAAKGAADVLLAVAPDQLRDLRAEPRVDLGVALGVVGQEVDRRELDRLQERRRPPGASRLSTCGERSARVALRHPGPEAASRPRACAAWTSRAPASRPRPDRS